MQEMTGPEIFCHASKNINRQSLHHIDKALKPRQQKHSVQTTCQNGKAGADQAFFVQVPFFNVFCRKEDTDNIGSKPQRMYQYNG